MLYSKMSTNADILFTCCWFFKSLYFLIVITQLLYYQNWIILPPFKNNELYLTLLLHKLLKRNIIFIYWKKTEIWKTELG